MESDQGNNNARTLFGIDKIPSDNHVRSLLDEEDPEILFPAFRTVFEALEEVDLLNTFRVTSGDLLIAFDGVEYHSSSKIDCPQCRVTEHKAGKKTYSHSMVTSVIVKPGCPHVIDLEPEFIVPQNGHDKVVRWSPLSRQNKSHKKINTLAKNKW